MEGTSMAGRGAYKRISWFKWLLAFAGLFLLLASVVALWVWLELRPPARGPEVQLQVPAGAGTREIAALLEREGLVRNGDLFWYALLWRGEGQRFKAGDYTLRIGMAHAELIRTLNGGGKSAGASFRLTVPEGMTVKQLQARLQTEYGYSEAELTDALRPERYPQYPWLSEIPADEALLHPLEGYLFPDTYEFKRAASAQTVIATLLAQLEVRLRQLPADWRSGLEKQGVTFHQMLTIASLVEREVVVPEERELVAGVIYNRLAKKMPLQIDATVQYLLPAQKERLLYKDLEIDSPYNTYRNGGLPPGPIANPGLAAIRAALTPAKTDYYFYVTRKDGTPGHWFAKTYEEHLRNIAKSKR
jgi:UPF0755 protein